MIFVLSVLLLLLLLLYRSTKKPRKFPPGPDLLPFLGSIFEIKKLLKETGFHHLAWAKLAKHYGPVVGLRIGNSHNLIIVSGYPEINEVLNREEFDGRPNGYIFRLRTMGKIRGILFTDGELWREQRRFSVKNLRDFGFGKRNMETLILEEASNMLNKLKKISEVQGNKGVPMQLAFVIPVLNTLWSMTAGVRYMEEDEKYAKFIHLLAENTRNIDASGGILNYIPMLRFIAPNLSGYSAFEKYQITMWNFFKDIVRDHMSTFSDDHPRDLIDMFLKEMKSQKNSPISSFTESQLIALCKDLFAAGSETTSNSLSFAIMFMVLYPEIQRKVQSELDKVVGRNRLPCLDDKVHLPYTSAVLMESQRVGNVGPHCLPHRALVDTQLGGYDIPKDSTIIISLWSAHMNSEHWHNPEEFTPERFINNNGQLIQDPWLMPFGTGRRRCLGETMAKSSMFLFFATLLQSLTFTLPPDATPPSHNGVNGFTLMTEPFNTVITVRS